MRQSPRSRLHFDVSFSWSCDLTFLTMSRTVFTKMWQLLWFSNQFWSWGDISENILKSKMADLSWCTFWMGRNLAMSKRYGWYEIITFPFYVRLISTESILLEIHGWDPSPPQVPIPGLCQGLSTFYFNQRKKFLYLPLCQSWRKIPDKYARK